VVVVTNQSGVGRGYFPEGLVREVHERMIVELRANRSAAGWSVLLPARDGGWVRMPKTEHWDVG